MHALLVALHLVGGVCAAGVGVDNELAGSDPASRGGGRNASQLNHAASAANNKPPTATQNPGVVVQCGFSKTFSRSMISECLISAITRKPDSVRDLRSVWMSSRMLAAPKVMHASSSSSSHSGVASLIRRIKSSRNTFNPFTLTRSVGDSPRVVSNRSSSSPLSIFVYV